MYYQDATGLQHESYEAACEYYGADTPADLEAEDAYYRAQEDAEDALLTAEYGRRAYVEVDPF